MMIIPIREYVVAAKDVYIPVPYRGIVVEVKGSFSEAVAAADTVDVLRDSTSVNKITVGASNTAEGVVLTGTPDSTNKDLVFDPDSSTAANKVIKLSISALETNPTTFNGHIVYDDMAIT